MLYVLLSSPLGFVFGLLAVEINVDMMLTLFILYCMPRFNNPFRVSIAMSIIFYLLFFWFKLNGKFLNYSIVSPTATHRLRSCIYRLDPFSLHFSSLAVLTIRMR